METRLCPHFDNTLQLNCLLECTLPMRRNRLAPVIDRGSGGSGGILISEIDSHIRRAQGMKRQQHRRAFLAFMTAMMLWLSVWTPACLAMGAAQSSMPSSIGCNCPFAGQPGGMAAGCAQVDGLSTYFHAKSTSTDTPSFHVLPMGPVEWSAPVRRVTTALPKLDLSPPPSHRPLNLRYCVFLI